MTLAFPFERCLLTVCLLCTTGTLGAQAANQLTIAHCPTLNEARLSELLHLELGEAASLLEHEHHTLRVTCSAATLELSVVDSAGAARLSRTISSPPVGHTEPERLIALAGAQLILAVQWLPVAPPAAAPAAPATTHPAQASAGDQDRADAHAPPSADSVAKKQPPSEVVLWLGPAVHVATRSPTVVRLGGAAAVTVEAPAPFFFGGEVDFSRGTVDLGPGSVTTSATGARLVAGARSHPARLFSIAGGAILGLTWFDVVGASDDPEVQVGSTSGVAPEVGAYIAPGLWARAFRVELRGSLTAVLTQSEGQIEGEGSIPFGGPLASAVLMLGLPLGGSP